MDASAPVADGREPPPASDPIPTPPSKRAWSRVDTITVLGITAVSGILRLPHLRRGRAVWDETVYVPDACYYVYGRTRRCGTVSEISEVHPPLAKWLIGAGIRLVGNSPLGWRIVPFVLGTLSIAVLYLLTRRLFDSTLSAALAASLFALDTLYFVLSRTAMLDIFVLFFGLVMFLCFVYDRDAGLSTSGARRLRDRPWLIGAGLAGGAATASKWSGGYLLAGVIVLAFLSEAALRRSEHHRFRRTAREAGPVLVLALVVIPIAVYVCTFFGRVPGSLLALPWSDDSFVRSLISRHDTMLDHHTGRLFVNPYTSDAWAWPLVKRPVVFDFVDLGRGRYQEVMAVGNPLLWLSGLIALAVMAGRWLKSRRVSDPEAIVLAGFVAGYVPWFVLTRNEAFIYYILPALPFLYIALAVGVSRVRLHPARAGMIAVLLIAALGGFAFLRPLLVGETISYEAWRSRIVFEGCGERTPDGQLRPTSRPEPPPDGWCWV